MKLAFTEVWNNMFTHTFNFSPGCWIKWQTTDRTIKQKFRVWEDKKTTTTSKKQLLQPKRGVVSYKAPLWVHKKCEKIEEKLKHINVILVDALYIVLMMFYYCHFFRIVIVVNVVVNSYRQNSYRQIVVVNDYRQNYPSFTDLTLLRPMLIAKLPGVPYKVRLHKISQGQQMDSLGLIERRVMASSCEVRWPDFSVRLCW